MPMGVKSSLCLVWNNSVLLRISRMDGGCIGVAMANRASCGGINVPSSDTRFWPWTSFRRPRKFRAWRRNREDGLDIRLDITFKTSWHQTLMICELYQEAGRVVEQAAEAAAEVSLQEGRVLRRDGLWVIGDHVAADLCWVLLTCRKEPIDYSGPWWCYFRFLSTGFRFN